MKYAEPETEEEGLCLLAATEGAHCVDRFRTSLARGERITRRLLPWGTRGAVGHHPRFSRVSGDYPTVSISLVLAMKGDTSQEACVAVGSSGPIPLHLAEADQRLVGTRLGDRLEPAAKPTCADARQAAWHRDGGGQTCVRAAGLERHGATQ